VRVAPVRIAPVRVAPPSASQAVVLTKGDLGGM
jgi:hypothetical protein